MPEGLQKSANVFANEIGRVGRCRLLFPCHSLSIRSDLPKRCALSIDEGTNHYVDKLKNLPYSHRVISAIGSSQTTNSK